VLYVFVIFVGSGGGALVELFIAPCRAVCVGLLH